jgi:hypothetical protein
MVGRSRSESFAPVSEGGIDTAEGGGDNVCWGQRGKGEWWKREVDWCLTG